MYQNIPETHREYFLHFQEDQDWGFVAMVLDRLFLWLFTTASLFGTFSILCEAPALWVFSGLKPWEVSRDSKDYFFNPPFSIFSSADTTIHGQLTSSTRLLLKSCSIWLLKIIRRIVMEALMWRRHLEQFTFLSSTK